LRTFAVLLISLLVCAAAVIVIPYVATPKPVILAEKLSSEPEQYIPITETSPVLLQAISNTEKPVPVNSLDEIGINSLRNQRVAYIAYQDNYYRISVLIGDPPQLYSYLIWFALFGLLVSALLLVFLSIRIALKRSKRIK
jgi:hypothetical protein